ncbi:MAG: NAD(P)/FAD-dependent oxidoreductase [Candidatus Omnitrophica bacterium]|nr:NAD(P)/FAD-dependent oxidoreductase [Candidatus Omnitrophota bacterium]
MKEKQNSCIVIGSGMAGLICAHTLQKRDVQVKVLEKEVKRRRGENGDTAYS